MTISALSAEPWFSIDPILIATNDPKALDADEQQQQQTMQALRTTTPSPKMMVDRTISQSTDGSCSIEEQHKWLTAQSISSSSDDEEDSEKMQQDLLNYQKKFQSLNSSIHSITNNDKVDGNASVDDYSFANGNDSFAATVEDNNDESSSNGEMKVPESAAALRRASVDSWCDLSVGAVLDTTEVEDSENNNNNEADDSYSFYSYNEVHHLAGEKSSTSVPTYIATKPVIKIYSLDDLSIKDRQSMWRQLPKPNMDKIRSRASSVTSRLSTNQALPSTSELLRRSVTFGNVSIRAYDQCLGDNPSVSYGPPVSLDWDYTEMEDVLLDDYESCRGPRRKHRQMMLNYYQRMNMLQFKCGISEAEIKAVEKSVKKEKRQRAFTKLLMPASRVEEMAHAIGRKTKRLVGGPNKKQ